MKKLLLIFLLAITTSAFAGQDDDFIAAREAFRVGDIGRTTYYTNRLHNYVLEPYAKYWQLRLRLDTASPEEIQAFLTQYHDTPLADRLRGEWLKSLAKGLQWHLFSQEYALIQNPDLELSCYSYQARLAKNDSGVLREVRPLWYSGKELPESCTPLFHTLIANGSLSNDDVWTRLRLVLEAGNISVAKQVIEYLPPNQAPAVRTLDTIGENAQRYLDRRGFPLQARAGREMVVFAITRVARSSPQQAAIYWNSVRDHFSESEQSYVWGRLALFAARKHDPDALSWFKHAGMDALSDEQLGWMVRSALRKRDWPEVLNAINEMSEQERREPAWRYWKARALSVQGKTMEANAILVPLSKEFTFYGQLASEELGAVIESIQQTEKPSKDEIRSAQELPAIQRALALYRLNMRYEGTREWQWAIRNLNDRQLLAVAEVAKRYELYDRAINTADKTQQIHDFSLRYIAPYREIAQNYMKRQQLDEAWVYGLIRQESRFVSNARSTVGASGLMQVMPSTAQWIAKRLGLKNYRQTLISNVETNLELGTYYLRYVLDILDNQPVLASAAYNAGPGRARQWKGITPLEGAIYVESIPFSETRDYVKKVMSNTNYYANVFGQRFVPLKQRLGTIAAKSGNIDQIEQLQTDGEPIKQ